MSIWRSIGEYVGRLLGRRCIDRQRDKEQEAQTVTPVPPLPPGAALLALAILSLFTMACAQAKEFGAGVISGYVDCVRHPEQCSPAPAVTPTPTPVPAPCPDGQQWHTPSTGPRYCIPVAPGWMCTGGVLEDCNCWRYLDVGHVEHRWYYISCPVSTPTPSVPTPTSVPTLEPTAQPTVQPTSTPEPTPISTPTPIATPTPITSVFPPTLSAWKVTNLDHVSTPALCGCANPCDGPKFTDQHHCEIGSTQTFEANNLTAPGPSGPCDTDHAATYNSICGSREWDDDRGPTWEVTHAVNKGSEGNMHHTIVEFTPGTCFTVCTSPRSDLHSTDNIPIPYDADARRCAEHCY